MWATNRRTQIIIMAAKFNGILAFSFKEFIIMARAGLGLAGGFREGEGGGS